MLKLLIILLSVKYLNATCDVCLRGRAACHSENTYSICLNGVSTRSISTCPDGYTCTGEKFICYPKLNGYKPICKSGDTSPIVSSTTPEPTTTEDPKFKAFCTNNGNGSYENKRDSTCKTFIWCYKGMGRIDYCQDINKKETHFNGKICAIGKPDHCT